jgi:hypothetical protein
MSELDSVVRDLIVRLKSVPEPDPRALREVHAALRQARPARLVETRRVLILSPIRALAWALLLVLATSTVWVFAWQSEANRNPAPVAGRTPVQFVFVAEQAQRISLVGDFNDWDPTATRMTRGAGGVWYVVVPLQPGRIAYSFVVDDKVWHADPEAAVTTHDFGRPSSVVYVAQTESL